MKKTTKILVAFLLCTLMLTASLLAISVSAAGEDLVTEYGVVPAKETTKSFAVFMNGEFQVAVGNWNAVWYRSETPDKNGYVDYNAYPTIHKLLKNNPGAEIAVVVLKDCATAGSMGAQAALGHLAGGNITIDLNDKTLTASTGTFIDAGLENAIYDDYLEKANIEKKPTTVTVKNGTLLMGNSNIVYVANNTTLGGTSNVKFTDVDFAFDSSVVSGKDIVFRGWGPGYGNKDDGQAPGFVVDLDFTNCSFDSRVYESLYGASKTATWFFDQGTSTCSTINFNVSGGKFITDGKMNVVNSNAADTTTFAEYNGSYATFSVPNGSTWQNNQALSIKGAAGYTYNPKMLVEDGEDYDVYTLPDVVTPYGAICSDHAYSGNFAIFYDGVCQTTVNDWSAAWSRTPGSDLYNREQSVLRLLLEIATGEKAKKDVVVYVRYDVSAGGMGDDYRLGHFAGGDVIVDLGGHTVVAGSEAFIELGLKNATYDEYLSEAGVTKTETNVTVKNGKILQKNYILTVDNDSTLSGDAVVASNVTFEKVTFGFDSNVPDNRDIVFRGLGGDNATAMYTGNLVFEDCTFDSRVYEGKGYLSNSSPKGIAWFYDGGKDTNSKVTYTVRGGQFISDASTLKVIHGDRAKANTIFEKSNGSYATFRLPSDSTWQTSYQLKTSEGTFYPKMLVETGADYKVYTLPTLKTEYGTITSAKAYEKFAIFMNGEFINAFGNWNAVWWRKAEQYDSYQTVHRLLKENPGAEITILVRQDTAAGGGVGDQAYLGHLAGGTITVDLGGNTVIADANAFFRIGRANASYDDYLTEAGITKTQTNLNVKNGTLLQGKGHVFYVQNNTTDGGASNVNFENVTFGYDNASVYSNEEIFFRGWAGAKNGAAYVVNTNFKNCTFDVTGFPLTGTDYPQGASKPAGDFSQKTATWFFDDNTANDNSSTVNFTVDGGQFITDAPDRMAIVNNNAKDTLTFVKTSGSYVKFSVPAGKSVNDANLGVTTPEGTLYFLKPVDGDDDRSVYTLLTEFETAYGKVPGKYVYESVLVFGDAFVNATNDWNTAQQYLHTYLSANNGKTATLLLRNDVNVTAAVPNTYWLGEMNGNVVFDLGGYTIKANNGNNNGIINAGTKNAASADFATSIIVKNGTLLAGAGSIANIRNDAQVNKTVDLTFAGVTLGIDAENVQRDVLIFAWNVVNNGVEYTGGTLECNLTLDGCTVDTSAWGQNDGSKVLLVYKRHEDAAVRFDVEMIGGQLKDLAKAPLTLYDWGGSAGNTVLFSPDESGNYTTVTVANGKKPTAEKTPIAGYENAYFDKLLSDGNSVDVYTVQAYESIETTNLLYLLYNGTKYYKITEKLLPAGATYETYYLDAADMASKLTSVEAGSIRLGATAGIRFATEIKAELLAQLEALLASGDVTAVEFGTLVAPASYGKDNGFTIEELQALGRQYLNIVSGYDHYLDVDEDDATTHFVGSVVNLYEKSVSLVFRSKGYAKLTLKSGEIVMLYANGHDDSVQAVAKRAKYVNGETGEVRDWYNGLADADKNIVDAFVTGKLPANAQGGGESRKLNGLNVLTIGDSLFEGHTLLKPESWIGQLASRYNWNLTNLGKNGATVGNSMANAYSIYDQLMNNAEYCYGGSAATYTFGTVAGVTNDQVDLVIVEGGVNDWRNNMPLGTLEDTNGSTVLGAWQLILNELKATYKNAKIVLVTSWYVEGMKPGGTDDRIDYVKSLKTVYEACYADDAQFVLVDAGDPEKSGILMKEGDFKAAYTYNGNDDNHLNAKGMEIMAEYMSSELKKISFDDTEA